MLYKHVVLQSEGILTWVNFSDFSSITTVMLPFMAQSEIYQQL